MDDSTFKGKALPGQSTTAGPTEMIRHPLACGVKHWRWTLGCKECENANAFAPDDSTGPRLIATIKYGDEETTVTPATDSPAEREGDSVILSGSERYPVAGEPTERICGSPVCDTCNRLMTWQPDPAGNDGSWVCNHELSADELYQYSLWAARNPNTAKESGTLRLLACAWENESLCTRLRAAEDALAATARYPGARVNEERSFSVEYHGDPVVFFAMEGKGWRYKCPLRCCNAWHWIDTESGSYHRITSAANEPVSVVASLKCPCYKGCSWHVMIEKGVARDA